MNGIRVGVLALTLVPAPLFADTPARIFDFEVCAHEGSCRKASRDELDRMRGGFTINTPYGQLEIAISITRAVSVNDQLVAVSQLVLPNASEIAAAARAQAQAATAAGLAAGQAATAAANQAAAQALANAGLTAQGTTPAPGQGQGGTGGQAHAATSANATASAVANASSPSASGASASANAAGTLSLPVTTPTQVTVNGVPASAANPVTVNGAALVVQNGPGNITQIPASLNGFSLPTVVQNSLNDQVLRTLTLINASVNSMSALSGITLGEMLSRATAASAR
jgi:hypothetical protein